MSLANLEGIRVLEFARYQAGPRCGMVLADLGAEVIKVERPGGEETRGMGPFVNGQSVYFSVYNRGKKSICIDLRTPDGLAVAKDLVGQSDIVIENFRPGTIEEMGLGYEQLRAIKRDIILVSVSGFGQYGPYRSRPGFDNIGQAMSGLMALTGQAAGSPIGTAASICDRVTALHATIGALAALHRRDRTGEGDIVDVCLMDTGLTLVEIPLSYYLSTGEEGGEAGRKPYKASDGWVTLGAPQPKVQDRLRTLIGAGESSATGMTSLGESLSIRDALEAWCADNTVDDICAALEGLDIPYAPVRTIPQVAADPHVSAREMMVKIPDAVAGEMHVPGLSIKFTNAPGSVGVVPLPGQHTDEVLGQLLGYDSERVRTLRERSVV